MLSQYSAKMAKLKFWSQTVVEIQSQLILSTKPLLILDSHLKQKISKKLL